MPLASADRNGMVLYCGSFTKAIAPAFRVGYLVTPDNVVRHLSHIRRIIDRQGDVVLENAVAELLQHGIISRHLRKSLRLYRQRRDVLCKLLEDKLKDNISFDIPEGGMAVWASFDKHINLQRLAEQALKKDLYFAGGIRQADGRIINATRLGFASSTPQELEHAVDIIAKLINK